MLKIIVGVAIGMIAVNTALAQSAGHPALREIASAPAPALREVRQAALWPAMAPRGVSQTLSGANNPGRSSSTPTATSRAVEIVKPLAADAARQITGAKAAPADILKMPEMPAFKVPEVPNFLESPQPKSNAASPASSANSNKALPAAPPPDNSPEPQSSRS